MDALPEFVTDAEEGRPSSPIHGQRTGWETVIFQVDDEPEPDQKIGFSVL